MFKRPYQPKNMLSLMDVLHQVLYQDSHIGAKDLKQPGEECDEEGHRDV